MNSGEITQEYDQHLGPVNSITFVDENRRFVTTSDDKTIRAWDFDIPVVIKYIAEPHMHSMPAVTLHPSSKFDILALCPLQLTCLIRKILCRSIPGQSDPDLFHRQFPPKSQKTVCWTLSCWLRMSSRVFARWEMD
jgi:WD40 repeat protein